MISGPEDPLKHSSVLPKKVVFLVFLVLVGGLGAVVGGGVAVGGGGSGGGCLFGL